MKNLLILIATLAVVAMSMGCTATKTFRGRIVFDKPVFAEEAVEPAPVPDTFHYAPLIPSDKPLVVIFSEGKVDTATLLFADWIDDTGGLDSIDYFTFQTEGYGNITVRPVEGWGFFGREHQRLSPTPDGSWTTATGTRIKIFGKTRQFAFAEYAKDFQEEVLGAGNGTGAWENRYHVNSSYLSLFTEVQSDSLQLTQWGSSGQGKMKIPLPSVGETFFFEWYGFRVKGHRFW